MAGEAAFSEAGPCVLEVPAVTSLPLEARYRPMMWNTDKTNQWSARDFQDMAELVLGRGLTHVEDTSGKVHPLRGIRVGDHVGIYVGDHLINKRMITQQIYSFGVLAL